MIVRMFGGLSRQAACVFVVSLLAGLVVAPAAHAASPSSEVHSVVVLGDSVAAGEGTLDGYRYQDRALLPGWSETGARRPYDGSRPACHQSPRGFGRVVARALGAAYTTFACSGATFDRGINLDAAYERAEPDLVLVSAGANSVEFERVFAYCVLASRGLSDTEAASIASAPTITESVSTAISTALTRVTGPTTRATPGCTAANPGSYLQRTVLDRIPQIAAKAQALGHEIRTRGRSAGRVPEVVFTTYFDPLPDTAVAFTQCPDGAALGTGQLEYMHGLLRDLNRALADALADAPGAHTADPGPAFAAHRWCDADPWVYGTSILVGDASSTAPFHPTPAGQRAIADAVLAVVQGKGRSPERGDSGPI
jgi:lysophospholipase L1-like esterase